MVPDSTDCKVTEDQGLRQGYCNEYYILNTIRFRLVKEAFYRHRCLKYSLTLQSRLDRTFFVIHRIKQQGWKHSFSSQPPGFSSAVISSSSNFVSRNPSFILSDNLHIIQSERALYFFKSHVIIQFVL